MEERDLNKRTLMIGIVIMLAACGSQPQSSSPQDTSQDTMQVTTSTANEETSETTTATTSETTTAETTTAAETTTVSETTTETETASEPEIDESYKKLYSEYLLDYLHSDKDHHDNMSFSLCDMSGDGIPELVFSPFCSHYSGCMVFTVANGEMVQLKRIDSESGEEYESFGSNGYLGYYPENRYIYSGYSGSDHNFNELYQLNGTELKSVTYSEYYNEHQVEGDDFINIYHYLVDGKDVTVDEFHDAYSWYDGIWIPLGRSFLVTDEMVEAVFTDDTGMDKAYDLLMHAEKSGPSRYCLYDIDGNGTDELILDRLDMFTYPIYTYDQGLRYMGSLLGSSPDYSYGDYYRYTVYENDADGYGLYLDDATKLYISEDRKTLELTNDNGSIWEGGISVGYIGGLNDIIKYPLRDGGELYTINYIPVDEKAFNDEIDRLSNKDLTELVFTDITR